MTDIPFTLDNVFFVSLKFNRVNQLPETINIPIQVEFKTITGVGPCRFQVNLRVRTPAEDAPLRFETEMVGLFDFQREECELTKDMIAEFVLERGLMILFPYVAQMVRIISGQMGMNPVNIATPVSFGAGIEDVKKSIVAASQGDYPAHPGD